MHVVHSHLRPYPALLALEVFLLFRVFTVAQDTPIGTPGTEVAPEDTPAAVANTDSLRKAAQNPVVSLISVPVQNNNNFNVSADNRIQDILNIQPVIPIRVSEDWNLINRIITPIIYQPTVSQPVNQGAYGFGDLNPSFFSPRRNRTGSFGAWVQQSYYRRRRIRYWDRASGVWVLP